MTQGLSYILYQEILLKKRKEKYVFSIAVVMCVVSLSLMTGNVKNELRKLKNKWKGVYVTNGKIQKFIMVDKKQN